MANLYLDFESDDEYHRYLEQSSEGVQHDENEYEFCPDCACHMNFYQDMEIENDLLYSASGGYDGYSCEVWYECPGCGYSDK